MKDLVEYIARSLVNDPVAVRVEQRTQGSKVFIHLQVAREDMGRVIGKNGRVANAMRQLLRVAASRTGKSALLDIDEPR